MAFPRKYLVPLVAVVAALAIAIGARVLMVEDTPRFTIGGPFNLVDQDGRAVTEKTWDGKLRLMFFGYTFCPDVCPTELQTMAQVFDKLGPKADKVVGLFVTVDPERDTPQVLKAYTANFSPRIVGLTGGAEQVAAAERAFRVYARKAPVEGGAYLMDHSAILYLMNQDGKFLNHFGNGTSADEIVAALQKIL